MCRRASLPVLAVALLAVGCGGLTEGRPTGAAFTVVATTTQMGDFVRAVGGERVMVEQILGPNVDPHDYEPRPSDSIALGQARVVFRSGGDPDEWLDDLIDAAGGGDAPVVKALDSVHRIEDEEAEVDPHWWQDPRNAATAVTAVEKALVEADPQGRTGYERNARAYGARLTRLDRSVARCIEKVPRRDRKLVTTHDALGYYADRYGIEVVGALIPSLSSQAQPSSKATGELVAQIEDLGVKAIFPESSLNPRLEEAVARESGASVGEALWADTLGPAGSGGATYIESIQANTEAIVDGLSGGEVKCRPED